METPLMKQYYEIKKKYKDMILFYRVGDFYETFGDDARVVSKELNIVLTSRNRDNVPMAGIPYHALYSYVGKLVNKGYKVALCEQLEDPRYAKGIVKRDVVRIFTAGTVYEEELLVSITNYICSISQSEGGSIVFADVSTGEFRGTSFDEDVEENLISEIQKINPREIVIANNVSENIMNILEEKGIPFTEIDMDRFKAMAIIKKYLKEDKIEEISKKEDLTLSVGALFEYREKTNIDALISLSELNIYSSGEFLILDDSTIKNLEIFMDPRGDERNSLLGILDFCNTKMGGRILRRYIYHPSLDVDTINERLEIVEIFYKDTILRLSLIDLLKKIPDLERIWSRIEVKRATPQDLILLKRSSSIIKEIAGIISSMKNEKLKDFFKSIESLDNASKIIENSINENFEFTKIKDGYDSILDNYRKIIREKENLIQEIEKKEIQSTGIKNLRIGYNDVFGYYIEVSKTQISKVPAYFIRKQTLKNVERYTTQELQNLEYSVSEAKLNIDARENELYNKILEEISKMKDIKEIAKRIGILDFYITMAELASRRNYTKPIINKTTEIEIIEGRHPVLELQGNFIPNDAYLDTFNNRFLILTGPNMSGKSTYMRQIALIIIMAQIGSFVPAKSARIGIVDRIFTRIGASDDILRGRSTFLNEMIELANILKNATSRSFIILDEVGRGTSTFDGLSIAWAAAEYIHNKIGAKTIFATHYHQLIELEKHLEGVKNYHLPVVEENGKLVFTRKLKRGGISESYGIEVASMAGLPEEVLKRAKEILKKIEEENVLEIKKAQKITQKSLMEIILKEEIMNINVDEIDEERAKEILKKFKNMLQG
ncbi:MAG: DNA mismatch repair protein MutS [Thermoplasmata archaeon]